MKARMIAVAVLLIGLSLYGCTKGNGDGSSAPPAAHGSGGHGQADQDPTGIAAEVQAQGMVDKGETCVGHDYMLKPGESFTLSFALKLPPGTDSDLEFTLKGNPDNLERSTGMQVSVASVSSETYPYPVWNIDCSEAFSDLEASNEQKPVLQTGHGFSIAFSEDGTGIVVPSGDPSAELTEEDLRAKIGAQIRLGGSKSYDYGLSRGTGDAPIALVDVSVVTPAEPKKDFSGVEITLIGGTKHRLVLTATKRRNEPFYRISGPDERGQCFQ